MLSKKLLINSISLKMTSTEIALLLNNDSEKIIRIGEIIGKKIKKRDNFEELNKFEKTFIYIDIFENQHHREVLLHQPMQLPTSGQSILLWKCQYTLRMT